jgi:DNA repair protein RadC
VGKTIHNFTLVESVYSRRLHTIQLRFSKSYASGKYLVTLGDSDDVEDILRSIFKRYDVGQEHFVILILNLSREIVGFKLLASGTQTSVLVDKALIFRSALLLGASAIILAHNHPNGNLTPSPNDLELTESVVEGGRTVDIDVLDHFIVGPNGTCGSMKEQAPHIFFPIRSLPRNGD